MTFCHLITQKKSDKCLVAPSPPLLVIMVLRWQLSSVIHDPCIMCASRRPSTLKLRYAAISKMSCLPLQKKNWNGHEKAAATTVVLRYVSGVHTFPPPLPKKRKKRTAASHHKNTTNDSCSHAPSPSMPFVTLIATLIATLIVTLMTSCESHPHPWKMK